MVRLAISLGLLVLALSCSSEPARNPGEIYDESNYALIDRTTDCRELQKEFDTAMTNAELPRGNDIRNQLKREAQAFAIYIDSSMKAKSCY